MKDRREGKAAPTKEAAPTPDTAPPEAEPKSDRRTATLDEIRGVQLEKQQFELETLKRRHVPIEEIESTFAAIGAAVAAEFERLNADLPTLLSGKSETDVHAILKREFDAARKRIATREIAAE